MHFSSITLPFLAIVSSAYAQGTLAVYSDTACKKQIQTIKFSKADQYQCMAINSANAMSVKFSTTGYAHRGYNVWDSDYCAGDMAGGLPSQLGTCLSAPSFGVLSWKSAHVAPRNAPN